MSGEGGLPQCSDKLHVSEKKKNFEIMLINGCGTAAEFSGC